MVDAAGRTPASETDPKRRFRVKPNRAVVITFDTKGRAEFQELDLDLAQRALQEHYQRRVQ